MMLHQEHMVSRGSSYFSKGGHSATPTEQNTFLYIHTQTLQYRNRYIQDKNRMNRKSSTA